MSAPAVARLSSPGEILAVLPSLCGFFPTESLVLLSLRGPRSRLGLTARVDLPPEQAEGAVAALCVERLHADGADQVLVALWSEHGRRPGLVAAVRAACEQRDLLLVEALHVQDGRWTSYSCAGPCCPASGTPLPTTSPSLDLVEVEQVRSGQVVLASRDELVRSVAPPALLLAEAAGQRLEQAARAAARSRVEHGPAAARARTLELAHVLLDRVGQGLAVSAGEAAALTVGLTDVLARDALATVLLTRSDELLSLLLQVAGQVVPPHDAPVCALLAWVAHSRGNGALANVALDRALAGSPDYSLALLLREALDRGVPPQEVRAVVRDTATVLRRRAPGRRGR